MVIRTLTYSARKRGSLMVELLIALALLLGALIPLAYFIDSERRFARSCYQRAVAVEIVDGEMEALMAGGWRTFEAGTHEYPVRAGALTNLPSGQFLFTVETNKLRLEWQPAKRGGSGKVVREATIK